VTDSFMYVSSAVCESCKYTHSCVTWLTHVWHDSFMYVSSATPIHVCETCKHTLSCVTWLIHVCEFVTHSCMWVLQHSLMCVRPANTLFHIWKSCNTHTCVWVLITSLSPSFELSHSHTQTHEYRERKRMSFSIVKIERECLFLQENVFLYTQ